MRNIFLIILIIAGVLPLFFLAAASAALAASGDVAINEIGAFEQPDYEWIEIYNRGGASVDLSGWKFYENETNHNLSAHRGDLILDAGEYAIIANKADKFIEKYSAFSGTVIDSSFGLNESGESVALKDMSGNLIDQFIYISAPNYSLERVNPDLNDYTAANWQEHSSSNTAGFKNSNYLTAENQDANQTDGNQPENQSGQENQTSSFSSSQQALVAVADAGPDIAALAGREIVFDGSNSKGENLSYVWNFGNGETADGKIAKYAYEYPGRYVVSLAVSSGSSRASDYAEVLVYPAGIYVSEFMPNPAGADEKNEWIEIANESDLIADISDFQIGDGSSDTPFKIPENTFIAPKSYLVFSRKAAGVSLNNDADKIVLRYPNGAPADGVEYEGGAKEGYAAARKSGGEFVWTKNATPGSANVFLGEGSARTSSSSAGAAKPVSENSAKEIESVFSAELAAVGKPALENAIYFLPEVSAKTVAGYDGEEKNGETGGESGDSESGGQTAAILKAMSGFGFWLIFAGAAGLAVLISAVYRRKKI